MNLEKWELDLFADPDWTYDDWVERGIFYEMFPWLKPSVLEAG